MELKPMSLPIELVLNVITQCLPKYDNVILAPSHPITQTLLSFTLVCRETHRLASRYLREHCVYLSSESQIQSLLTLLRAKPEARRIPAMSLDVSHPGVEGAPSRSSVLELMNHVNISLRRLVIDVNPRSRSTPQGRSPAMLPNIEELVLPSSYIFRSEGVALLDGYLLFSLPHFVVDCTHLRRLALWACGVGRFPFWAIIGRMPRLQTLVLICVGAPDLEEANIKVDYFRHCSRPLKLLLVNTAERQVQFSRMRRQGWDSVDPGKKMTIMTYNVPMIFAGESADTVCCNYVRAGAENGTLWDWEGEVIQHPLPLPGPE